MAKILFKPGQSGNPKGRPTSVRKEAYRELREDILDALGEEMPAKRDGTRALNPDGSPMTKRQAMVANLFRIAIAGASELSQLRATEIILNRIDGTPRQQVEHSGSIGTEVIDITAAQARIEAAGWTRRPSELSSKPDDDGND